MQHLRDRRRPFHKSAVEKLRFDDRPEIGDRIVVNPNTFCGTCEACRAGYRNHCTNMKLMGITTPGGFAEYVKCTELQCFHISEDVPLEHAAFAEPLACAMNGFSRLDIHPWETCCVFGCGPIGLMFAQSARKCGARVVCVEPNDHRIAVAKKLGFDVLKPTPDLAAELKSAGGDVRTSVSTRPAGSSGVRWTPRNTAGRSKSTSSP